MKHRGLTVALVITVASAFVAPGVVLADAKTVKKIEKLNREAMENYDLLDYEAAKRGLNGSLALVKRRRLGEHTVAAQTHLYLGIVEFSGFGDRESALLQFMDATTIDSGVDIPAAYRTAELTALLKEARSTVGGSGGGGGDESGIDCSSLMGMNHEMVDEANAGTDRKVSAHVAADVGASKVALYYRTQGESLFIELKMKKSGGCRYVAVIPGEALQGEFLHYYVAALNKKDKTVASKGSAGSPNIIEIRAGGGGGSDDSGGAFDNENPLDTTSREKKNDTGGTNGSVGKSVAVGPSKSKYFLSLALGSGGAYVTGVTESTKENVGCCFAPALFQVFPEIGYMLNERSSISLAFRMGFPIGANIEGHSTGAPAGLLRYRKALDERGEGIALSGLLGGGIIRNTVKLVTEKEPGMDTDTVALGPLLVGAGASYLSGLGGPMKFVAELNAIAGIPVVEELQCNADDPPVCVNPQFGVQLDFNIGLLFAF